MAVYNHHSPTNPGTDFDTVEVTGNYKEPLIASADNCITKSN